MVGFLGAASSRLSTVNLSLFGFQGHWAAIGYGCFLSARSSLHLWSRPHLLCSEVHCGVSVDYVQSLGLKGCLGCVLVLGVLFGST